jgi:uncharacterized membrane protein YcaP (DUF421 family)
MLLPSKYEDINSNLLVVGSLIISTLKKRSYNIEDLFQSLRDNYSINLEQYFNALTFLWLSDIVILSTYQISLNRK